MLRELLYAIIIDILKRFGLLITGAVAGDDMPKMGLTAEQVEEKLDEYLDGEAGTWAARRKARRRRK